MIRPIGEELDRFVVKDPRTGAYFQIGPQEHFLLNQLDGVQRPAAVRRAFEREFGEPLSEDDLGEFLALADAQSLIDAVTPDAAALPPADEPPADRRPAHTETGFGDPGALAAATAGEPDGWPDVIVQPAAPAPAARRPAPAAAPPTAPPAEGAAAAGLNLLYWHKSLFDPDRLFGRLTPLLWFVWTRGFLAVSAAGIAAAAVVVAANWGELVSGFAGAVRWQTAALVGVTLVLVTALHEFAHGLTLKRYGGEVREVGVLFIFFLPSLFCNVSDAWLLRERWKRMLVTLAGGYWDLCAWAAAVFVWRLTPLDSLPNHLAFVATSVIVGRILFNFNPFMKLDGYYLLSDLLEVPNLMGRGQARAKAHLRRLLWGAPPPPADPRAGVLTAYGLASWVYGLVFLGLAVYGSFTYLWEWLGWAGVVVGAGGGAVLVRMQFAGLANGEVRRMLATRRARAVGWAAGLVAAVAGVVTIPVADRASGPFRVRTGVKVDVRAPLAGVVREVRFDEGEPIPAGAVVARLEVPDLASRQARKRAEVAEAKAKLDLLEAGPSPAMLADLTERAARAEQWLALGRKDLERAAAAHKSDRARLEAAVARCEAEGRQVAASFERLKTLRRQGAASLEEYDAAAARVEICLGQLDQSKAELQSVQTTGTVAAETELARRAKDLAEAVGALAVLKAGPRPEELAAARAVVARAAEEARYLDGLDGQLTVTAPCAGLMMTARPRERVGRHVQEGDVLCEVEDVAAMEVEVLLREGQIARVAPGQEVQFLARALPFQTLRGRVVRVAPGAHKPTEQPAAPGPAEAEVQLAVYCVLESGGADLRPGMTGHARVRRGECSVGQALLEGAYRTVRTEFWR